MPRGRTVVTVPGRGRSPRRKTTWGHISSNGTTVIPADTNILLAAFVSSGLANLGPTTLVRVRGLIVVSSDQSGGIEHSTGALGISVVTDVARAAGSIQGPITNGASDSWQTWVGLGIPSTEAATAGLGNRVIEVDSKGQRKLGDEDAIIVAVECAHATEGFEISIQLRFLFMLH